MLNKNIVGNLCENSLKDINKYLYSPTHNGIWKLEIKWSNDNLFHNMIKDLTKKVTEKANGEPTILLDVGKKTYRYPAKKLTDDFDKVTKKITPLYFIFYNALMEELGHECEFPPEIMAQPMFLEYIYENVSNTFNEKITNELSESYKIFKEEIFCDEFIPKIISSQLNKLTSGYYHLVTTPVDDGYLIGHSLSITPLKSLQKFLISLGIAEESNISMVFSPEEEVFRDYITYVDFSKDKIFKQHNVNNLLHRAISHNVENNYLESVSNIGLICEDILTQVYETLFREPVPKGLTIGQLNDTINLKVQDIYPKGKLVKQPELKPIYNELKLVLEAEDKIAEESVKSVRSLLNYISENNKYFEDKIDRDSKKPKAKSIYPVDISEAITELLKYRNAASHRSKIPIGSYEAIRSLHCSVKFYLWWDLEKYKIDWEKSQEDIIKDMVSRYEK